MFVTDWTTLETEWELEETPDREWELEDFWSGEEMDELFADLGAALAGLEV